MNKELTDLMWQHHKVCVTIRERVCSGVERDWQFTFDSEQEAKNATKVLPHNCWIVKEEDNSRIQHNQ